MKKICIIATVIFGLLFWGRSYVLARVAINEFYPIESSDWVELYNDSSESAVIRNYLIKDSQDHSKSLANIEDIPAYGYRVVSLNILNKDQDSVILFDTGSGVSIDSVVYGSGSDLCLPVAGQSIGRLPDISGEFVILSNQTPGQANSLATALSCPTATATPAPTFTPTPKPTSTPKPTLTIKPTPTSKPTSTPTPIAAIQQAADFAHNDLKSTITDTNTRLQLLNAQSADVAGAATVSGDIISGNSRASDSGSSDVRSLDDFGNMEDVMATGGSELRDRYWANNLVIPFLLTGSGFAFLSLAAIISKIKPSQKI